MKNLKTLKSSPDWRADQLREFMLHLKETLLDLREIHPRDRRDLERSSNIRFTSIARRTKRLYARTRTLERKHRQASKS